MGIILSISDQIKLLRDTAANITERVKYVAQVDFDECLLECTGHLLAITTHIDDACRTMPEQVKEPVFEGRRIWE